MKELLQMKTNPKNTLVVLLIVLCVSACLRLDVLAQVRPVNDYGALGIGRLLKRINTTASVLMVGAHPDDEDSALLAYLARGENARTAYLSLTRGDGGQNIIGPELFEALGVIRTEELLQARRLDGAEQYFTRAYDYGFSKTLDEAKQKWYEKVILCDAVKVIRDFRPLVVISRFSGTPSDGHGQHQFAGYITPLAVNAAADPKQCLESAYKPWTVRKLYIEQGFGANAETTLRINTGTFDPLLGRSYFEIAMEGRSMHRSQGEGRLELRGDQFSGLNLVGVAKDKRESSIFEGIDTSITGLAKLHEPSEPLSKSLEVLQAAINRVAQSQPLLMQKNTAASFAEIFKLAENSRLSSKQMDVSLALVRIKSMAVAGIQAAAGIQIDSLAERETATPGEKLPISVRTYFPDDANIKVKDVVMRETCRGIDWGGCGVVSFEKTAEPQNTAIGGRREMAKDSRYFIANFSNSLKLITQPYWIRMPPRDNMFVTIGGMVKQEEETLPFSPPLVVAEVTLDVAGAEITIERPVEYRFADPSRGEIRRELNIVEPVTLKLDKAVIVVPYTNKPQVLRVVVTVTNNSNGPAVGGIGVGAEGWKISPETAAFELKRRNETANIPFDIAIPADVERDRFFPFHINAIIKRDQNSTQPASTMHMVAYPHIQTHRYYTSAEAELRVVDLKVAPVNVGYVMGSGDEVPEAIRQMGLNVTMLDEKALASRDLTKFATIVVGIRASETRPDLVSNFKRLMDYMTNGGNLIMQYQRGNFAASGLMPYPVSTTDTQRTAAGSISRVVDENAKVTILDPKHPIFNFPNKITEKDFDGWVQERNAYNLVTFDPQYTPLLESHDAGEAENKGGLVIAKVGKGNYVYCSYSMFRQLPAGVPGAYRLFANVVSLPKSQTRLR